MGAVQPINATKEGRSPEFAHRLQAWGAALCFGVFALLPLNCASTFGGALARLIRHEKVMRSMQLLCEKVQPRLH